MGKVWSNDPSSSELFVNQSKFTKTGARFQLYHFVESFDANRVYFIMMYKSIMILQKFPELMM